MTTTKKVQREIERLHAVIDEQRRDIERHLDAYRRLLHQAVAGKMLAQQIRELLDESEEFGGDR